MAESSRSQCNMSEKTFDFICTGCDKKNKTLKAVKYCVDCKVYYCQPCTDMHEMFPPLAGHSFLGVGQGNQSGNQQSSLPELPTERCCKHKAKVIDMYCQMHDQIGCCTCMATDHRSCLDSKIFSVPDMLGVLSNLSDSQLAQRRLQQMMDPMQTLNTSKDDRLQCLKKSKAEAIDQIEKFQHVLETIFKIAVESSKEGVENAYKNLEIDIMQDKGTIDNTNAIPQATDDKLNKTTANRTQRFVCSNEAEKNIKTAGDEMMIQESNDEAYVQGLSGTGDVPVAKKKGNLYKLTNSRDINIKSSNDVDICRSFGCSLIHDNQLLVTDVTNQKLKRIDTSTMTVTDYCSLDSHPIGICCISQKEVAVACCYSHKIQFVSIEDKMTPSRKIDTSHVCHGIAIKDDNLYVTDEKTSLYVYDMNGTLLRTIINDNHGKQLFSKIRHIVFSESGDKMFVGDESNGIVCFDGKDNYLSTIKDNDLNGLSGVCTDGRGNIFVTGYWSNNVVQYSEDGKKIDVVIKQEVGLKGALSMHFSKIQNRLLVTMDNSNILKMYELE